jgi:predicted amidohydrolase
MFIGWLTGIWSLHPLKRTDNDTNFNMILASAQTKPKRGDINTNLLDHYRLIKIAADNNADLIAFPEMSITGYEREDASLYAFLPNDSRLDPMIRLAVENNITVIAGAPIKIDNDLFIGGFVISSDSSVRIYTKQFLHTGEEDYYKASFAYNPIININNERISLAICADIVNPLHPENASKTNTSIYISSIFFSPNGILSAHDLLSNYAKRYSMCALMSNFCGESWGQASGGRSAFWDNTGRLIAQMNDSKSGLLIVERNIDIWTGRIISDEE